jgi:hypothetical protein
MLDNFGDGFRPVDSAKHSMKFSRFVVPAVLGLVCLPLASREAHAVPINVPDFSFETDPVADGSSEILNTAWIATNTSSGNARNLNPIGFIFPGSDGAGVPAGGDGPQIAYITGNASFQSRASLANVQADSCYSLTVALGDSNLYDPGNLRIGFLIGDAFVTGGDISLPQAVSANYSPEGAFTDFTFSYNSTTADVGKSLKVFFGQTAIGSSNSDVSFDNVRLSVVPTPEPSTYAMMALGLVALCVLGAKRKKDGEAI